MVFCGRYCSGKVEDQKCFYVEKGELSSIEGVSMFTFLFLFQMNFIPAKMVSKQNKRVAIRTIPLAF